MQKQFKNAVPVPMEDPIIHTDEHPFCRDLSCPCHNVLEEQYYDRIALPMQQGLLSAEDANHLYFCETI